MAARAEEASEAVEALALWANVAEVSQLGLTFGVYLKSRDREVDDVLRERVRREAQPRRVPARLM